MRKFSSPDQLLYRYVEQRERLGSARALSITRAEGYKFDARCKDEENCSSQVYIEKLSSTGKSEGFVCFRCGEPWGVTEGRIMPAELDITPRPGQAEEQFAELATLERLLGKLTLWERRVWAAYLLADLSEFDIAEERGVLVKRRRVDSVVLYAQRRWPYAKQAWYRNRVWGLVKAAREKATAALEHAKLWEGES